VKQFFALIDDEGVFWKVKKFTGDGPEFVRGDNWSDGSGKGDFIDGHRF
jgi:hypothetical protein